MTESKYYCPLPFRHLSIRLDLKSVPCCMFKTSDVPEDLTMAYPNVFHDHPFMNKIRKDILDGKPVAGCSSCYESEEITGRSQRTDYIGGVKQKYNGVLPTEPKLTYIDFAFSNVCNNRCRMCGPHLSTNWYSDAKALGQEIPKGLTVFDQNVFDKIDFSTLNFVKMFGGEPLMEQEKIIQFLNKCNLDKLGILMITNCTSKPSDELLSMLIKCERLDWLISVDYPGMLNDFLRKGSKWEEVKENLNWYIKTFPQESLKINTVVSIYNINNFYHMTDYMNSITNNFNILYNPIVNSDWMMPKNLPLSAKAIIEEQLIKSSHPFAPMAINEMKKEGDIQAFLHMDKKLNAIRKENWFECNPELYELLKEYYD